MNRTHFLFTLLSAACLTFTGCKKNNADSPAPDSGTLTQFFAKYGAKEQAFTVNLDADSAFIVGKQGTKITFPKSAFVTKDGLPVTGQIAITLTEIYKQSDMVLSDKPTTSDGQLLESGGEICISAFLNGDTLRLARRKNILIQLPTSTRENDMQLFTGSYNSGSFNWTPLTTITATNPLTNQTWVTDSLPTSYYDASKYIFSVTKLGWINCDRFYSIPNKTTIEVQLTNIGDMAHTEAYLVFKDINSVASFHEHSSAGQFISNDIPVGESVTIVAFSLKEGKQYFVMKEITITENLLVNMNLAETSENALRSALESLN
jgi:hypothetical protein